jgi:histidinol-phosphate aminotransferase
VAAAQILSVMQARVHGGPDARGAVPWDFSTNVNAAGPSPHVLQALARADATRYPDPSYTQLRRRLALRHGVDPGRIIVAASASEFIQRITAVCARLAPGPVAVPQYAYGDYAAAARACGLSLVEHATQASLTWFAEPSSPHGQDAPPPDWVAQRPAVLDAVYAPLRIAGQGTWPRGALDAVFQLHSPNKALGVPGVRGAYAIAPVAVGWPVDRWLQALAAAEPSWPLSSHAVVLLDTWCDDDTQTWLAGSLPTLRQWTAQLRTVLHEMDLDPLPSVTPFVCARRPQAADALRASGVAVRDGASFGLRGWMRLSAQAPAALDALRAALQAHS